MIEQQRYSPPGPEVIASVPPAIAPVIISAMWLCPRCGAAFKPRSNKTYCTNKCAKAATRNQSRGPRSRSRDERYRNYRAFDLLGRLNERYYGTPPGERLGLLKNWLDAARFGQTSLGCVLANPEFFAPKDEDKRRVCFRRNRCYPPVSFLADHYCRTLLGCRVWEWVNGNAKEPRTGEVKAPVDANRPSGIRSNTPMMPRKEKPKTNYIQRDPAEFFHQIKMLREKQPYRLAPNRPSGIRSNNTFRKPYR